MEYRCLAFFLSGEMPPILIPFFFIGLWLAITGLFAVVSGWLSLADRFRAVGKPEGRFIPSQVKSFGVVPENRVTHLIASPVGLYIYASFLFRFLHPALLIPWSHIGKAKEIERFWLKSYVYELNTTTSIVVTRWAHEVIESVRPK